MVDDQPSLEMTVDGRPVVVDGSTGGVALTLLDVLRDQLGVVSVKDGCSPQGQCGCCTVLVDGQPRVACVTPARRVAGRQITTLDGLDPDRRNAWASAFCATGASQCGFCTPGIIVRLDALATKLDTTPPSAAPVPSSPPPSAVEAPVPAASPGSGDGPVPSVQDRAGESVTEELAAVDHALLAHLCRCTGWQTIGEAWQLVRSGRGPASAGERDLDAAGQRARLEGGVGQRVGPEVALGRGRFAADTVPQGALVAVSGGDGSWALGETMAEARAAAGKVQGRRTTAAHTWPLDVPDGEWTARLRTTWVEPAYLETDASWCAPGGTPYSPVANGGAFGAKTTSPTAAAARELADRHNRSVLAVTSREDATRWGPKRPPVAGGANPDGTGVLRVVATPGIAEAVARVAPGLTVEEIEVPGPPTSAEIRAAGWAEAIVLLAGAAEAGGETSSAVAPNGAEATAGISDDGTISVTVRCGPPLDEVVLRSYCIGAAHMAWSWLTSEALTVDPDGEIVDLTIRSFGIVRAVDTPRIEVAILDDVSEPRNGSDAVFAAVAAAGWRRLGRPQDWPTPSS